MADANQLQRPEKKNSIPEIDYFEQEFVKYRKLLSKYHQVVLFEDAIVKTDPVFLVSEAIKKSYIKFTLDFMSPLPWFKRKDLPESRWGDVYMDCMVYDKKNAPGGFVLENIRRGAVISGFAVLKPGEKPMKKEGEGYRSNWVYGDYTFIVIYDVRIERPADPPKKKSPYKSEIEYSPYYKELSDGQTVSDEDIIFNF